MKISGNIKIHKKSTVSFSLSPSLSLSLSLENIFEKPQLGRQIEG